MTQQGLANLTGLPVTLITAFERAQRPIPQDAAAAIQQALEAAGVTFLNAGDLAKGAGVALRDKLPGTPHIAHAEGDKIA